MISFARQDLILRPIEKRLYLFADERSEGENKCILLDVKLQFHVLSRERTMFILAMSRFESIRQQEERWGQYPACSYNMPSHTTVFVYCRLSTVFLPYRVRWLRCRKLMLQDISFRSDPHLFCVIVCVLFHLVEFK